MGPPSHTDLTSLAASVSNEVLLHWDVEADRISWHGNVRAYLGTGDDPFPATRADFLRRIHPDHRRRVREALEEWLDSDSESCAVNYLFGGPGDGWVEVVERARVLRDDDGCPKSVVSSILALDPLRSLSSVRDERKSGAGAREDGAGSPGDPDMYRAMAENASDIITVMSHTGEILYESPSLKRVLGYDPSDLIGRNAFELIHPDDRERVRRAWEARPGEMGFVDMVEYRCRHADGSWRHLESSGRRPPEGSQIEGVLVISRDVSDRRELEERLQEARKMEAVGRLVSGIAHDFNNLLTVITCNTDILMADLEGHSLEEEVEEIRESAQRAGNLTRDLLAFGRQENLRLREIELIRAIRDLTPLVQDQLGDDIDFQLEAGAEEAWVQVDPPLARQVLFDLVSNARDAMPNGGEFRIEVKKERVGAGSPPTKRGVEPGDWIHEAYTDTGTGMPEPVRQRAFEPFFSTKEGRSGLGLSTVYGLVKQSDGELWIESSPGGGTTVHIYLPDVGDRAGKQTTGSGAGEDGGGED